MKNINNMRLYILGAGFSHSYDKQIFPLTNNLLSRANELKILEGNILLKNFLSSLFNKNFENINFEKVATFLYNNPFSSEGEPKQTYELLYIELISTIAKIYGNQSLISNKSDKHKIEILKRFSNHLHKTGSVVISFNYDLIIENFLSIETNWNPINGYHLPLYNPYSNQLIPKKPIHIGASILKLHGSLNWGIPPEEILNTKFDKVILDKKLYKEPIFSLEYREEFNSITRFYPFLIPPVSGKVYQNEIIRNLWKKAKAAIQSFNEIHIIGYSLPESDTSVEFLFRLGSDNSIPFENKKTIHIVDPFLKDEKKDQFNDIFKSANNDNKIIFHKKDAMEYLDNLNMNID